MVRAKQEVEHIYYSLDFIGDSTDKSCRFIFFYFNEIGFKKERTKKMRLQWISKDSCITEEKNKLIKTKGGGFDDCAPGS